MNILLKLFWIFLKIGAFTFGGGYAMVPIIQKELVENQKIIEEEEFLDYIAMSQSFPGAIAINLSILLGYKLFGYLGSFICVLGIVLPSLFSILILAYFYCKGKSYKFMDNFFAGVRPVVVALLINSFLSLFKVNKKSYKTISIMIISFLAVFYFDINPIFIILIGSGVGLCIKS